MFLTASPLRSYTYLWSFQYFCAVFMVCALSFLGNIVYHKSDMRLLGSRQAVVRQSSGSCQAVVRQSSGSRQAVVKNCFALVPKNVLNFPCSRSLDKLCLALLIVVLTPSRCVSFRYFKMYDSLQIHDF